MEELGNFHKIIYKQYIQYLMTNIQNSIAKFQVFIISWNKQHERAISIYNEISNLKIRTTIIYSDPEIDFRFDSKYKSIKRPNDLFWGDKFKACLDNAGQDAFLVIHADCHCEDWSRLVSRCYDITFNNNQIGVWAPKISGTNYDIKFSQLFKADDDYLIISALTDGIIFYLAPSIINRMQKASYDKNLFGWGIDLLFCTASHVMNKLVIIDKKINITHPISVTGYNKKLASLQMNEFLKQFSNRERIECELLVNHVKYNYSKYRAQRN